MLSSFFAKLSAATLLLAALASAQTPAPAKHAFEVVSIRPDKTGARLRSWSILPDGYRVNGQSFWDTIMIAYFPEGVDTWSHRLQKEPSWINDAYDINARVAPADLSEWQKQGTSLDKVPMLREMLQTMLADRCKLVFHRIPGSIEGYALVVAKHGPKLAPSKPNTPLPFGVKLADGGIAVGSAQGHAAEWDFHSATIADAIRIMNTGSPTHPIVDRTGLAGKFDFLLRCREFDPDHPYSGCNAFRSPDALMDWDWASIGLHLEPTSITADTLVIDHIEKPSEN